MRAKGFKINDVRKSDKYAIVTFSKPKVIMADGVWMVPPHERPSLAPPPKQLTKYEKLIDDWINPLNNLPGVYGRKY